MAATVSLASTAGGRSIVPHLSLSGVLVTIAGNSLSYTATGGGLAFDLFTVLQQAAPQSFNSLPLNAKDIIGLLPLGLTTSGFVPFGFSVGTATATTMPCTVKLGATGTTTSAALGQIADGVTTEAFTALVLIARGGAN